MIDKPPILCILGDPDGPVSEVCRAATPAEIMSSPAVAALVAERDRLRKALEDVRRNLTMFDPPDMDGVYSALDAMEAATRAAKETDHA